MVVCGIEFASGYYRANSSGDVIRATTYDSIRANGLIGFSASDGREVPQSKIEISAGDGSAVAGGGIVIAATQCRIEIADSILSAARNGGINRAVVDSIVGSATYCCTK